MGSVYDVIVVGGGASGMMAAARAAARGKRVLLLEKNKLLGEKLRISGGGRCNVTNATYDIHALLKNYGKAAPFLFSPFSQFGVADTFSFFESHQLPLKVEALSRAFPVTDQAEDVVKTLEQCLQQGSVEVHTESPVQLVLHEGNRISGVMAQGKQYLASSYIFATGGVSHPETGSTGDGFSWLLDLGHTVKDPTPTIVPLKTSGKWSHAVSGTTIDGMKISFFVDGKKRFSKTGKLLFTHFGISGPLVLNVAGMVGDLLTEGTVTASIDLYPTLQTNELDAKFLSVFEAGKQKMLKNALKELIPSALVPGIALLLKELDFDRKVQGITKEERRTLVDNVKNLPLTITNLMGFDRAVVADGGVPLEEVDMKTMRSKKIENLFLTGDLLHINRPSGGYSLQLCWTTGWVAGSHA